MAIKTVKKGASFNSYLFRSPADEALYLRAYENVFERFQLTPEEDTLDTSFGFTHVNAFGSKRSPDLVLLHGMGSSSTMWAPNIEKLSRHFRIYALDTIGDLGKSRCKYRLRSGNDYANWFKEILDGLGLEKANIAGVSYGGWLALHFAKCVPWRVEKIVPIAPAATFQRIRLEFYIRMFPLFLLPIKKVRKYFITSFTAWLAGLSDITVLETEPLWLQTILGACLVRLRPVVPPKVLDDMELERIATPTLLLVGEKEEIYDPQKVLDRASRTMPNIRAQMIPQGTHMMSFQQKDRINDLIISYLLD